MNNIKKCAIKLTIKEYLILAFWVVIGSIAFISIGLIFFNLVLPNIESFLLGGMWLFVLLIMAGIAAMVEDCYTTYKNNYEKCKKIQEKKSND